MNKNVGDGVVFDVESGSTAWFEDAGDFERFVTRSRIASLRSSGFGSRRSAVSKENTRVTRMKMRRKWISLVMAESEEKAERDPEYQTLGDSNELGQISVSDDRVEFGAPGLCFARSSDSSEMFFDELRGLLKLNGS